MRSRPSCRSFSYGLRAALALALAVSAGCLQQVSTGTGTTGGSSSGSGSSSGGATSADGGSPFTGCGTDPTTGVTLCLASSACSGLSVDTSAFPQCGFRQGGTSAYDVECLCNGTELCPVGAPTSCDALQQLLTQQASALTVCEQVASGSCLSLSSSGSSSSGSSSGGATGSPCSDCVAGCGGTPACYQSCGC